MLNNLVTFVNVMNAVLCVIGAVIVCIGAVLLLFFFKKLPYWLQRVVSFVATLIVVVAFIRSLSVYNLGNTYRSMIAMLSNNIYEMITFGLALFLTAVLGLLAYVFDRRSGIQIYFSLPNETVINPRNVLPSLDKQRVLQVMRL